MTAHTYLSRDRLYRIGRAALMTAAFLLLEKLLDAMGRRWVLGPLVGHGVHQIIRADGPSGLSPYFLLPFEIITALSATLATIALAAVEHRPWTSFGIAGQRKLVWLSNGLLAGLAGFSLLIALLAATNGIHLAPTTLTSGTAVWFGLLWLVTMVILAVHEEMAGRGYPFLRLAEGIGPVAAALVTSALFLNAHRPNAGENVIGLLQVAAAGMLFCFSIWRTGSLWWAIGFHCTWDWVQLFIFGTIGSGVRFAGGVLTATPVGPTWLSGGSAGPEGSVLCFVGLSVGALALLAVPNSRQPSMVAQQHES